jgi:tRNA A-37 threonylcarbamoyl transferase component Bud32
MKQPLLSVRDSRNVAKDLYTLLDKHFYSDFHVNYQPNDGYLSIAKAQIERLRPEATVARAGLWTHVRPIPRQLPAQGWKIHVSATTDSAPSILERVAASALQDAVHFKFALDANVLRTFNSKRCPRGQSGKFITLYPTSEEMFRELIEKLYGVLRDDVGPYILSDRRYKDCRALYYRYGQIGGLRTLQINGTSLGLLTLPDGQKVQDVRNPYFSPPFWAADPFPPSAVDEVDRPLKGRYRVTEALSFSNAGGVYLAQDLQAQRSVVIKESRAHTCFDDRGNNAISLLKREYEALAKVQDTGVCPKPIELFEEWENCYLAEEFIESVDIRGLILTNSPFMLASPTRQASVEYYSMFVRIAKGILHAIHAVHERGLVVGDVSPKNLRVDPETHAVRLIDFEAAYVLGDPNPAYLYTPGFSSPESIRKRRHTFDDDRYAAASVLAYMLFPNAAMSAIRDDFFRMVNPLMCRELGWEKTAVSAVIIGLANRTLTCTEAANALSPEATRAIEDPFYRDDIDEDFCRVVSQKLGAFLLARAPAESRPVPFPADPFAYATNGLSLGFGTCGVLYALQRSGIAIPDTSRAWLVQKLREADPKSLPPGLMTGHAGIAWCLAELGLMEQAQYHMRCANESDLLPESHSYLYGMAGVGLMDLYFYHRTGDSACLKAARSLAQTLITRAKHEGELVYWEENDQVNLGLGYGQSGVALFLLRLFQLTGDEALLVSGRNALEFDLTHGTSPEPGVMSYPERVDGRTLEPYLEVGTAGIVKVALRYGLQSERLCEQLRDVHRKYCVFPGLFFGLAGCAELFIDAFFLKNDSRFLQMARRPLAGIRDLYLLTLSSGVAVPGEGLFRISCDYATGIAGVLRSFSRFVDADTADFMLDEIGQLDARETSGLRKLA